MNAPFPPADPKATTRLDPAVQLDEHPLAALNPYERAVYQRQTALATELLLKLTASLNTYRSNEGLLARSSSRRSVQSAYTRIAAAISAHVTAPDFALTIPQFNRLCAVKWTLEAVFATSGYGNARHLLEYESRVSADGKVQLKLFLALFYSLDDIPDDLMLGVLKLPGKHLLPLMLGWLGGSRVLTLRGEERCRALLQARSKLEGLALPVELLLPLAHTWMLCSYASDDSKHDIKQVLNAIWRNTASVEGVKPQCRSRRLVEKPTLVVAAERMIVGHAMHRSYEHCLLQLRSRFQVALVVRESEYDPATAALFDEVVAFPTGATLREIASRLIRLQPDLIFYPSLGMSDWTQAMANLRMAPIQFMTPGHPATSMSDTLDYALIQACHAEAAGSFSEKVVVRRGSGAQSLHSRLPQLPPRVVNAGGTVHIAVNSHLMKLSPRFLAVCVRLWEAVGDKLHFHFFPSAPGVRLDDLRQRLSDMIPPSTVHEPDDYPRFMANLSRCDMALSAFPFGNTNSAVDTCLLGIPMVAYRAPEILSLGDRDVMEAVGLPTWLLADSDETYYQAALRLIRDKAVRQELTDWYKSIDVGARLTTPIDDENPNEFVDAVWWLYQKHDELQSSAAHTFRVDE